MQVTVVSKDPKNGKIIKKNYNCSFSQKLFEIKMLQGIDLKRFEIKTVDQFFEINISDHHHQCKDKKTRQVLTDFYNTFKKRTYITDKHLAKKILAENYSAEQIAELLICPFKIHCSSESKNATPKNNNKQKHHKHRSFIMRTIRA
ncbi:MAG TPA: hypothetical protein VG621_00335 [Candidatus Paceibacterota bacterium]|nr:hypothetical protein [Candidatus Paceibacterota bacterium]